VNRSQTPAQLRQTARETRRAAGRVLSDVLARASTGLHEILTRLTTKLTGIGWDGRAERVYEDAQAQWPAVMEQMADMLRVSKRVSRSATANLYEAEPTVAALGASGRKGPRFLADRH
jgi:uncharacterized protein YukE